MISVDNNSIMAQEEFDALAGHLELIGGLNLALEWALSEPLAGNIPEVLTQDEFTHDVVFSYGDKYIVFDTT
ncbi:MAG: hypothetical protein HKN33_08630 [Pyrinomonadaceae bacterium]|nr:hypothetical protein [Pyrinomonadaceae bacterium]